MSEEGYDQCSQIYIKEVGTEVVGSGWAKNCWENFVKFYFPVPNFLDDIRDHVIVSRE